MRASVEAAVLELRRSRLYGPWRLVFELATRKVSPELRLQGPGELGERVLSDDRIDESGSVTLRVAAPATSPPRYAELMGLALRGYLVLVLGATAGNRRLLCPGVERVTRFVARTGVSSVIAARVSLTRTGSRSGADWRYK